jgi:S-adenosylmethionine decarboxylase proenzyme
MVVLDGRVYADKSKELNDSDVLHSLLEEITRVCGLTKVNECTHAFEPQGFTMCHVLAESHVSIHTWPECSTFALDVYSCKNDLNEEMIKRVIERHLGGLKDCKYHKVVRNI